MLKLFVHRVNWILHLPSNIAALWNSHDELAALVAKQREDINRLEDIVVEHHEWIRERSMFRPEKHRLLALHEPRMLADDEPHTEH
jgi:SMC interacting uncharacterized protein involved in chromosome segregation